MKERPILFSGPMVRAILEGRKTQTRRVIKKVLPLDTTWPDSKHNIFEQLEIDGECVALTHPCPYGKPGDRLWVRETWGVLHEQYINNNDEPTFWKADYSYHELKTQLLPRWKPPIHMPRNRSRISLEITNIHIERVQDISKIDAIEEGLKALTKDNGITIKYGIPDIDGLPCGLDDPVGWPWIMWQTNPIAAYEIIWDSINGFGSWNRNPWVWVICFKRAESGHG